MKNESTPRTAHHILPGDTFAAKSAPILSEYDKQAADFLAKYGIKCRITLSNTKTPQWDGPKGEHNHYRVTLSKSASKGSVLTSQDMPYRSRSARLVFDFFGSANDAAKLKKAAPALVNMQLQMQNTEPHLRVNLAAQLVACEKAVADAHPSAYDILACVSSDSHCPETFADFCGEFGYDDDSIKARQLFARCSSFAKRIRAFFTSDELESLREIN